MKTSLITTSCAAAFTWMLLGTGATAATTTLDHSDKSFLSDAYQDGMAEVKMGEMGASKSANADIKAFGQHMTTDHSKANSELKALAVSKGLDLPSDVTMVAKGKAKLLEAKSGADFDKAYAEAMVSDHKKAVSAFEKAANEAKDAEVKAFATKTLPTLQMHLSMAEDLNKKVSK